MIWVNHYQRYSDKKLGSIVFRSRRDFRYSTIIILVEVVVLEVVVLDVVVLAAVVLVAVVLGTLILSVFTLAKLY